MLLFFFFKFIYLCNLFIFGCVGSSLLHAGFLSSCGEQGLLFKGCGARASHCGGFSFCGARAPDVWASAIVAHRLGSCGSQALSTGSVVVVHGLSCLAACGIFLDQGSNLCPLNWQADSQPLHHQGSQCSFLVTRKAV